MSDPSLVLEPSELEALTGFTQAHRQLEELRRQGFVRARRSRLGTVILERAHYEAVCAGVFGVAVRNDGSRPEVHLLMKRPQLKPLQRKTGA